MWECISCDREMIEAVPERIITVTHVLSYRASYGYGLSPSRIQCTYERECISLMRLPRSMHDERTREESDNSDEKKYTLTSEEHERSHESYNSE